MAAKAKYIREDIIQAIIKMKLQHCASQLTILNFLKNDCKIKQTQAYGLIGEAHKIIAETYKHWNKDMLEQALADLEEQKESAKLSKDRRLVLEITKEMNKIKGMYIERVEHSGEVKYVATFPIKNENIDGHPTDNPSL
jgi:hypothetical protein